MKTVLVVVAVAIYSLATLTTGLVVGAWWGWTKRRTIDRYQLEDADKVIGWAIEERQHAIDALFDRELHQLLDEGR